jgi:hypothetical protein
MARTREELLVCVEEWIKRLDQLRILTGDPEFGVMRDQMAEVWVQEITAPPGGARGTCW